MSLGVLSLLVLAVSIDGFSAGLSFGLRKLIIPLYSLLIISALSFLAAISSMLIGNKVAVLIPVSWLPYAGGAVLIGLGLYIATIDLIQGRRAALLEKQRDRKIKDEEKDGGLHILTTISQCPDKADLDRSGELGAREALLLGLVLSADVFGAGVGASMIGLPIFFTALAAGVAQLVLIPLGVGFGRLMSSLVSLKMTSVWAGVILILVGVINML